MAKTRGAGGRFAGGEDFVPGLPMERYMNVTHVPVTAGAAGAGGVAQVDTGMTVEAQGDVFPQGRKWVLFGGIYQPVDHANLEALDAAGVVDLCVTLFRGQIPLADVLDTDRGQDNILARGMYSSVIAADIVVDWPKPLDLLHPLPILSRYLTVGLEHNNDAVVNGAVFDVALFWGWAALNASDRLAILQASL